MSRRKHGGDESGLCTSPARLDRIDEAVEVFQQVSPLIWKLNEPKTFELYAPYVRTLRSKLRDQKRLEQSVRVSHEHVQLCRTLGNQDTLGGSLIEHGQTLVEARRIDEGSATYREAEQVLRGKGDLGTASMVLIFCASSLFRNGRSGEADVLVREAYRTSQAAGPGGNHRGCLFGGISQFALQLTGEKKPDQALAIFREGDQWMTELNEPDHRAWLLFKQAEILQGASGTSSRPSCFPRFCDSHRQAPLSIQSFALTFSIGPSASAGPIGSGSRQLREHDLLCRSHQLLGDAQLVERSSHDSHAAQAMA
jgi:hypothetical protein